LSVEVSSAHGFPLHHRTFKLKHHSLKTINSIQAQNWIRSMLDHPRKSWNQTLVRTFGIHCGASKTFPKPQHMVSIRIQLNTSTSAPLKMDPTSLKAIKTHIEAILQNSVQSITVGLQTSCKINDKSCRHNERLSATNMKPYGNKLPHYDTIEQFINPIRSQRVTKSKWPKSKSEVSPEFFPVSCK